MNRFKHLAFLVIPILFVLLALNAGSSLAQETNAAAACAPTANQVALYEHFNYGGRCKVLRIGNYPNPAAMGFPDNMVSSVKVGANVRVVLYEHQNYAGRWSEYLVNDNYVANEYIGDNATSSVRVDWRAKPSGCVPKAKQIALFVNANYGGQCIIKEIGDYLGDIQIGLPNDTISSVKVGQKVRTTVYEHSHIPYGGNWFTYVGDDPNLGNDRIGDNTVSSLKVKREPCPNTPSQVALYQDFHFEGQCKVLGIGSYPTPAAMGYPNDMVSSVDVGANVKLTLYQHVNYGGVSSTFLGWDQYLGDNTIGDNAASSAIVQPR